MNLSITQSILPDIYVHPEHTKPSNHYPVVRQPPAASFMENSRNSADHGHEIYKYYVIQSTDDDRVYNRFKNVETMYHQARGQLVDIYV